MSNWDVPFAHMHRTVLSRHELVAWGATTHGLTAAVRGGFLVRPRRDRYCLPGTAHDIVRAVRVGGRLACVSALASYGVFAFDTRTTHIQLPTHASRLRRPEAPRRALADHDEDGVHLHWVHGRGEELAAGDVRVGLADALRQSLLCQKREHAIASLDNAINQGLLEEAAVADLFSPLPQRIRTYQDHIDGRAEAGQESVLRLLVRDRGLACELQPVFVGVGRADMLVEGCLIVEADSRAHHDGWEHHVADRERDLKFAVLGFPSLRPAYNHTMYHPDLVGDAIESLVAIASAGRRTRHG